MTVNLNCNCIFIGKSLGKGTFGKVKLANHALTGEKVRNIQHYYT